MAEIKRAARTYGIRFGGAMAAYVVVLLIAMPMVSALPEGSFWRAPLALAPVVPLLFVLLAFVGYLRRMDELQRMIQLEALGFGFGATVLFTIGYGFLEGVGFPNLELYWVGTAMILLWGAASAVISARYR